MSFTLNYQGLGTVQFLRSDTTRWSSGAGAHLVHLGYKAHASWVREWSTNSSEPAPVAPILLTGRVYVEDGHLMIAPLRARVINLFHEPRPYDLEFSVSDDQITAIDRARERGDVRLAIDIEATLLRSPGDVYPIQTDQERTQIAAATWIDLLDQAGREIGITIRVPSPLSSTWQQAATSEPRGSGQSLSRATSDLREARNWLHENRWQEVAKSCRNALENIRFLVADASNLDKVPDRKRDEEQRWASLHDAALKLAHAAVHSDEVTVEFTWGRADAEAILGITAALLRRYADL